MTLIGGHVVVGTPAPQGAAWFSSTQLRAESAPRITMPAPVEMRHQRGAGCGALEPAAIGQRGGAARHDAADVGAVATDGEGVGVDEAGQPLHRARLRQRLAQRLQVGHDGEVPSARLK